jgi:hypothetical protein
MSRDDGFSLECPKIDDPAPDNRPAESPWLADVPFEARVEISRLLIRLEADGQRLTSALETFSGELASVLVQTAQTRQSITDLRYHQSTWYGQGRSLKQQLAGLADTQKRLEEDIRGLQRRQDELEPEFHKQIAEVLSRHRVKTYSDLAWATGMINSLKEALSGFILVLENDGGGSEIGGMALNIWVRSWAVAAERAMAITREAAAKNLTGFSASYGLLDAFICMMKKRVPGLSRMSTGDARDRRENAAQCRSHLVCATANLRNNIIRAIKELPADGDLPATVPPPNGRPTKGPTVLA